MANNFNPYQQPVYPTCNPYAQQPMYPPQMYQQPIQQMQPQAQPQQPTDVLSQILERLDRIEKALSTRPQKNYRKEGENNV